jgi:ABC-type glycerol-3-phosphate transport system substrate-binding protein
LTRIRQYYRYVRVLLIMTMTLSLLAPMPRSAAGAETSIKDNTASHDAAAPAEDGRDVVISYSDYIQTYDGKPKPGREVVIQASEYIRDDGVSVRKLTDYEDVPGISILMGETGSLTWSVDVEQEGLYQISALYYPVEGKSADIERAILIDGQVPFEEASYIQFNRVWGNEAEEIKRDNRDNDLRPRQVEKPEWRETVFRDAEGYYEKPFSFYLSEGMHTITLTAKREPMVLNKLRLFRAEDPLSYEKILKQYEREGLKETEGVMISVNGEDALFKSSPTLYPASEKSSPAVSPYSASKIRINTIGGYNWRIPGQWVEWEVEAPETGLYRIAFKTQQNFVKGIYSTRRLSIDGKVPFAEAEKVGFPFKSEYRLDVVGGEQPYLFKLEKGKHVLRLEAVLGEFAPLIHEVEESLYNLNAMYRKILMITGKSPDAVRDYQVEKQIPNILETFESESARLKSVASKLKALSGTSSDQDALLKTMAQQLDEMLEEPDTIPRRLSAYKTNTGGLGTWLLKAREIPLEIDEIYIYSPGVKLPKEGMSFLAKTWHEVKTFFYSFIIDYNQIGNVSESKDQRTVTVWIGSGRDQAATIKAMVDETFTSRTGINVNLELVQMQTLLKATLAGQGPDVAMQIGNDIPVNYAMRNATADLTQFPDFQEVAKQFRPSALVPYTYQNGVYALPETQTFNMLFYRKDVLNELGLGIPQTWDNVSNLLAILNKNHMEFGLPLVLQPSYPGENIAPNSVYAALLMQNGGAFYRNGGKESDLDSRTGVETFKQWTEFYTDYKLEREFDFANRFRTGQMPIGIADYTVFNQLNVFAPEIRGIWGFAPIPGTRQPDGTIRREVPSGGNGVTMLQSAMDKEAAWEFMKWWTGEEAQTIFGREMEGLMGAAARHPTANIRALEKLPWNVEDYENLKAQFEWVRGIPEVPGGYFTGRHMLNAFYKAINGKTEPREAMIDYVQYIQDEIRAKRKEFGLPE